MDRGQLLYSSPRNQRAQGAGNYGDAGALHIPDRFGHNVLTHVTAGAKSQTNRARSVAAGVVSGAGSSQPVIETPHSDESASSRIAPKLHKSEGRTQLLQGSGRSVCVLRVVPGTCLPTGRQMHTRKKRRD